MQLLEEVLKNVEERDYIDTHRDNSPLVLEDAIELTIHTSHAKNNFRLS
jgi:cytidylate kinase